MAHLEYHNNHNNLNSHSRRSILILRPKASGQHPKWVLKSTSDILIKTKKISKRIRNLRRNRKTGPVTGRTKKLLRRRRHVAMVQVMDSMKVPLALHTMQAMMEAKTYLMKAVITSLLTMLATTTSLGVRIHRCISTTE